MRITFLLSLLFFSYLNINAQQVTPITQEEIPSDLAYKGNVHSCVAWSDENGENYVIQTETPLLTTKTAVEAAQRPYDLVYANGKTDTIRAIEADYRIKGLFVYHYTKNTDASTLLWKNLDHVSECSFRNLTAEYLSTPLITDLDEDGESEVWLVYQLGCRAEKSVALGMKIILYKGAKSYTMRGLREVHSGDKVDGGEKRADDSFLELPQAFRDYVLDLWEQYKVER